MLVLSRRVGEAVLIAGKIRVVVLSVDRKGVRLGVEAPTDATILREELVTAVVSENRRAVVTEPGEWLTRAGLLSNQDRERG